MANELDDLAATGEAYLGSVTFMSEGMRPLIKASTSDSLDSLGGSSAERGQPCTRTRTLTWQTNACNNVCAQAEAQLLGFFRSCSSMQTPTATTFVFDDSLSE